MLMHLDASPHEWFAGLLMQDLVVALDERQRPHIVRRFFRQDGTLFNLRRPGVGGAQLRPFLRALHRPRQPLLT